MALAAALVIAGYHAAKTGTKLPSGLTPAVRFICCAPTQAGKDFPMKQCRKLTKALPKPRSDKDLVQMTVETKGKMTMVIDEVHSFFGNTLNGKSSYESNLGPLFLELCTSDELHFGGGRGKFAREYIAELDEKMSKIEKKWSKTGEEHLAKNEPEFKKLLEEKDMIENGIQDFALNFMGVTTDTAAGIGTILTEDNEVNGMSSRLLVLKSSSRRPRADQTIFELCIGKRQAKPEINVEFPISGRNLTVDSHAEEFIYRCVTAQEDQVEDGDNLVGRSMVSLMDISGLIAFGCGNNFISLKDVKIAKAIIDRCIHDSRTFLEISRGDGKRSDLVREFESKIPTGGRFIAVSKIKGNMTRGVKSKWGELGVKYNTRQKCSDWAEHIAVELSKTGNYEVLEGARGGKQIRRTEG